MGDFNEILLPFEVYGGSFCSNQAAAFDNVLGACELLDFGLVDGSFTWSRHRERGQLLLKKLDRGLGDLAWRADFPEAYIQVLSRHYFDHNPLLLCCYQPMHRVNQVFKFQAAWTHHPQYRRLWRRLGSPRLRSFTTSSWRFKRILILLIRKFSATSSGKRGTWRAVFAVSSGIFPFGKCFET